MLCECNIAISLSKQMKTYFNENLSLPILTPQVAIFEIFDEIGNDRIAISCLLLIFKLHVFKLCKKKRTLQNLLSDIRKYKKIKNNFS